ncbi:MAG: enoyl-CoA hydratase [Alphaproteobacteria bacterium]|nr:enoyl-CoA hydratase [Alphaproteobacteria bacterium]
MKFDLITYRVEDDVAFLGLNRPDKRNAINDAMVEQMREAITRAGKEAACGLLYGHGSNFSAGLDLAEMLGKMQSGYLETRRHNRHHWHEVFDMIDRGPIPFVSALHGPVVGGGLELASATHIRVADTSAIFGLPEGQRGIFVGGGGTVRIQRILGNTVMVDMMLTGRLLNVQEAERLNLVRYVTEPENLLAKAKEIAVRITKNTALTNWKITNVLSRVNDLAHDDGLFMEYLSSNMARAPGSEDRLRDFVEKRATPLVQTGSKSKTKTGGKSKTAAKSKDDAKEAKKAKKKS